MNFDNFITKYSKELYLGLHEYGFETMSDIQEQVLPDMCSKSDLIIQAKSGSGKSSLFCIASLALLNIKLKEPQILIILHTKELAMQIQNIIMLIGKYMNFKTTLCVGGLFGLSIENNNQKQKKIECSKVNLNITEALNSHIIIGTPGRLLDIIQRNPKLTEKLTTCIIDEADTLFNNNFNETLIAIINSINQKIQYCAFSATFDDLSLIEQRMDNPKKILVENDKISVDTITNYCFKVNNAKSKFDKLNDILTNMNIIQMVIFFNKIENMDYIMNKLYKMHIDYKVIHSKIPDLERIEILTDFRQGKIKILLATDILARGIDIQRVGLIVNYDIPQDTETYIHRIGRSGRYGRNGVAITFVMNNDTDIMNQIETKYNLMVDYISDVNDIAN